MKSSSALISPEEIAYAAALFMAAAKGQLPGYSGLSPEEEVSCHKLYSGLTGSSITPGSSESFTTKASLYAVFRQFWAFYKEEVEQESICGRTLAFHLLMECTRGYAIQGWTSPIEGQEREVNLHPAVIQAIGGVRFYPNKGFCRKEFEAEIRLHAICQ